MTAEIRAATWLRFVPALVIAGGFVLMCVRPLGLFSDSVSGFLVLRSMEHGAAFNHTFLLDESDIALDLEQFTAWWTPGQYLLAIPFRALGLNLGQCMAAITTLAISFGTFGYLRLFRALTADRLISRAAVALIVFQPYLLGWFCFYHGGELLLWAWTPWFTLLALRYRDLDARGIAIVTAAFLVGLVCKTSFAIIGGSVLAAVFFMHLLGSRTAGDFSIGRWLPRAALVAGISAASLFAYVSAGPSPADAAGGFEIAPSLRESLFAFAAPLGSLFDLWRLVVPDSESPTWDLGNVTPGVALGVLTTVALLFFVLRFVEISRDYKILVVTVYLGVASFHALAYMLDVAVSFQTRHYRVAGLLMLPGIVAAVPRLPDIRLRGLGAGALALACGTSFWLFAAGLPALLRDDPVGVEGFSHLFASQQAVDELVRIDRALPPGNNLIAVPWPQLALDVQHSRIYSMKSTLASTEVLASRSLQGDVDNLVVMIPANDVRTRRSRVILDVFGADRRWRLIHTESADHHFFLSGSYSGFD